ncbi:MAG: hypothetical protein BRD55_09330 [Bacteroidetes bacterium SW_9_63_38]|nr:MAG: hypothetical protein BRD55_09330 [Bacteroidetes bacterium SW_9_63_38]
MPSRTETGSDSTASTKEGATTDRWKRTDTLRAWGRLLRLRLRWWSTGHLLATVTACAVFLVSLWVIAHEVRGYEYAEVWAYLQQLTVTYILLAAGLTASTFVVLTGYDALALRYVDAQLSTRRIVFSAFIGYAVSQAIGNPILTGGSVRYRLYSSWGLSPAEVAKSILFAGLSFWLGFFALGGTVLVIQSSTLTAAIDLPIPAYVLGAVTLVPVVGYAGITWVRSRPLTLWGWSLDVPPTWMLPAQIGLAACDLALASSVVFVLLPPEVGVSLPYLLVSYLIALLAGLVSHVPGGLGVFESIMLVMLTPDVPAPALLGGLLAYRGIFHLLPLVLAALAFGAYELKRGVRDWTGNGSVPAD